MILLGSKGLFTMTWYPESRTMVQLLLEALFLYDPATNIAIRESLPSTIISILEVATHLGDGTLLAGLAITAYLLGFRRDIGGGAILLAVIVLTFALVSGLKGVLGIPRPIFVTELGFGPPYYPGYSTPSAHAMGATVVYGTFAYLGSIGSKRLRLFGGIVMISIIGLSRVVLGLHFLGDVLLGIVLGLTVMVVAIHLGRDRLVIVYLLALLVTIIAFSLGSREFTTMILGAAIGGAVSWTVVKSRPVSDAPVAIAIVALPMGVVAGIYLRITANVVIDPALEIAAAALGFSIVIALPSIAHRVEQHPRWGMLFSSVMDRTRS